MEFEEIGDVVVSIYQNRYGAGGGCRICYPDDGRFLIGVYLPGHGTVGIAVSHGVWLLCAGIGGPL